MNKYLLNDLIARGLWTPEIRNQIIADKGSVQSVAGIPDDLKAWKARADEGMALKVSVQQTQALAANGKAASPKKKALAHAAAQGQGAYMRSLPLPLPLPLLLPGLLLPGLLL